MEESDSNQKDELFSESSQESSEESGDEEFGSGSSAHDESGTESDVSNSDDDIAMENTAEGASGGSAAEKDSSASASESDVCPVCLNSFIGQELGLPESCSHAFCLECIQEWSKTVNTCPIDRTEFKRIFVKISVEGSTLRTVKVKVDPKAPEDALPADMTACEVCGRGDREDRLLLCDACDLGYHCECLTPALEDVPIEEWFCPPCASVLRDRLAVKGTSQPKRIIARTIVSEAVRSRIQRLRTGAPSSSAATTSSAKVTRRKFYSRKRYKRRRRKAPVKKKVTLARTKKSASALGKSKSIAKKAPSKKRRRRRRRYKKSRTKNPRKQTRRSMLASRPLASPSTKQRIADRLGLCKPPAGHSMPYAKKPSVGSLATADSNPVQLFGHRDQLMDFEEDFMNSDQCVPSHSRRKIPALKKLETASHCSVASVNLLDNIMAKQEVLHKSSKNIIIGQDGSLKLSESTNSGSLKKNKSAFFAGMKRENDHPTSEMKKEISEMRERDERVKRPCEEGSVKYKFMRENRALSRFSLSSNDCVSNSIESVQTSSTRFCASSKLKVEKQVPDQTLNQKCRNIDLINHDLSYRRANDLHSKNSVLLGERNISNSYSFQNDVDNVYEKSSTLFSSLLQDETEPADDEISGPGQAKDRFYVKTEKCSDFSKYVAYVNGMDATREKNGQIVFKKTTHLKAEKCSHSARCFESKLDTQNDKHDANIFYNSKTSRSLNSCHCVECHLLQRLSCSVPKESSIVEALCNDMPQNSDNLKLKNKCSSTAECSISSLQNGLPIKKARLTLPRCSSKLPHSFCIKEDRPSRTQIPSESVVHKIHGLPIKKERLSPTHVPSESDVTAIDSFPTTHLTLHYDKLETNHPCSEANSVENRGYSQNDCERKSLPDSCSNFVVEKRKCLSEARIKYQKYALQSRSQHAAVNVKEEARKVDNGKYLVNKHLKRNVDFKLKTPKTEVEDSNGFISKRLCSSFYKPLTKMPVELLSEAMLPVVEIKAKSFSFYGSNCEADLKVLNSAEMSDSCSGKEALLKMPELPLKLPSSTSEKFSNTNFSYYNSADTKLEPEQDEKNIDEINKNCKKEVYSAEEKVMSKKVDAHLISPTVDKIIEIKKQFQNTSLKIANPERSPNCRENFEAKPSEATLSNKNEKRQYLTENIVAEVKNVLKPFYTNEKISKENYKDIMRRCVPKILTNCNGTVQPQKIQNLVLKYVALVTNLTCKKVDVSYSSCDGK